MSSRALAGWSIVTAILVTAVFAEAAFAGAMLSGLDWARTAHRLDAMILIASAIAAGIAALIALRRVPQGPRFALSLLALGVIVFLQAAIGAMTAKGANLLWVHVPLGVLLFGFAVNAMARARRLGAE